MTESCLAQLATHEESAVQVWRSPCWPNWPYMGRFQADLGESVMAKLVTLGEIYYKYSGLPHCHIGNRWEDSLQI